MAEIAVPYTPGWIHEKDGMDISPEFSDIIKFYLLGNPCGSSSSGQTMSQRGWNKNVWKNAELRTYLLCASNLIDGVTYKKVAKLDAFSAAVTLIGLNGNFHNKRDANRIVFYNDGKRSDILTIIYYIRCAIAHGRFEIYSTNSGVMYALEAVTRKKGSGEYVVRARMVLLEETLLHWKNIIVNGKEGLEVEKASLYAKIQSDIKKSINSNQIRKKADIANLLPYDNSLVWSQMKKMVDSKSIIYDPSAKIWRTL